MPISSKQQKATIGLAPRLTGLGGMVSFQAKLIQGLEKRGIPSTFDLDDPTVKAILVIGGTRQMMALIRAHQRGVRIVQRLNGMNWLQRVKSTPVKLFLRAEANNLLLSIIRRSIADRIVYQSTFSKSWWELIYGRLAKPQQVVYNGVDLDAYTDEGSHQRPTGPFRLLLVEGHLDQNNRQGFDHAVALARAVQERSQRQVELCVAGDVASEIKATSVSTPIVELTWKGIIPRDKIPELDRSAHLLYSADLNAACPNSVIEALACGLPVIAFDTGALSELVRGNAGRVVPYGSNHWVLEPPVLGPLADAAMDVLENNAIYRKAARQRALADFGLDKMVESYLKALLG